MLETLKKLMDNLVSLFQKIRCSFTCCNSEVSVRVLETSKTMKPENFLGSSIPQPRLRGDPLDLLQEPT